MAYSGYLSGYSGSSGPVTGALSGSGSLAAVSSAGGMSVGNLTGVGTLASVTTRVTVVTSGALWGLGRLSVVVGKATLEQYVYKPAPPPDLTHRVQWRYIAERILTGEIVHDELPLTTTGPQWDLSGPGSLRGTIKPESLTGITAADLGEWATAIYAEADGQIRWGGIVIRGTFTGAEWGIEAAGFSTYPHGIPYTGPLYSRISYDPTLIFRAIWAHVQDQPDGNLGVDFVLPTNCPVRVGVDKIPGYTTYKAKDGNFYRLEDMPAGSPVTKNAASKLATAMTATSTTATLAKLENFGQVPFPATATIGGETVKVTARSGLKLTVTRGQAGTSATAHGKGVSVKFAGGTETEKVEEVAAEPYQLAWWNSTDCGQELDKLAQETPFDYSEEHYWTDAIPVTAAAPTLRVGYGNLEGGYDGADKGWMGTRADEQALAIGAMGVDLFGAVELHETTSPDMPDGGHRYFEGRMRALAGPEWSLADGGEGGNHLLYRSTVFAVLGVVNYEPVNRHFSDFTVKHLSTGTIFHVHVVHLQANDGDGTSRATERSTESRALAAHVTGIAPSIILGDFNSYTYSPTTPKTLLAGAGMRGLQIRATPVNSDLDSHGDGADGRWIDDMLTRDTDLDVRAAAGVLTNGLSDHQLWLSATLAFRGSVVPATRRIGHRIRVDYPRVGSRRRDLAFVQGENVTDVVTVTRDGDAFANTVYAVGQGEGEKSLRAEVAVRDGKLRRPYVYTDKAAGTSARLSALARAELARRALNVEVTSITVTEHPNARLAGWGVGDDILVQAELPWLGWVEVWSRVTSWSLAGENKATLTLVRSDSFNYGRPAT
jgi:hypothetical protein